MKTPSRTKWTAWLARFALMAVVPLSTAHAANKVVTTGTVIESGSTYVSTASQAALQVGQVGQLGLLYSGTNISATGTTESGNGRYGAYANQAASLSLFSSTIVSTGTAVSSHAVFFNSGATGTMSNVVINSIGAASYGVYVTNTSSMTLNDCVITTLGSSAHGLAVTASSAVTGKNLKVITYGENTYGLQIANRANVAIENLTVEGYSSGIGTSVQGAGIYAYGTSNVVLTGTTVVTNTSGGLNGIIQAVSSNSGAAVSITKGIFKLSNTISPADAGSISEGFVRGLYAGGSSVINADNVQVDISGIGSIQGVTVNTSGTVNLTNSQVNVSGDGVYGLYAQGGGVIIGENIQVVVTGSNRIVDSVHETDGILMKSGGITYLKDSTIAVTGPNSNLSKPSR